MTFPLCVLDDLMESIESRGTHATGIATCGTENPFIFKWARAAKLVLKSEAWKKTIESITPDTQVVIGHTRHATHQNSGMDEAAHPFKEGRVVGAHNGMIYNWREIEKQVQPEKPWIVDSQAAFGLLNRVKEPVKALEALDGYFALTWWKNGQLFMARSESAPLSVAYVPEIQTLFWNSTKFQLEKVLEAAKIGKDDYKLWEIMANRVYRFDPRKFNSEGTQVEKEDGEFKSVKRGYVNSARPPMMGTSPVRTTAPASASGVGNDRRFSDGSRWDSATGRQVWDDEGTPPAGTSKRDRKKNKKRDRSKQLSLLDMGADMDAMDEFVERLLERIVTAEKRIEALEFDLDMTCELLKENGITYAKKRHVQIGYPTNVTNVTSNHSTSTQADGADDSDGSAEDSDDPFERGAGAGAGTSLTVSSRSTSSASEGCAHCQRNDEDGDTGKFLPLPSGGLIHEKCVLQDLMLVGTGESN